MGTRQRRVLDGVRTGVPSSLKAVSRAEAVGSLVEAVVDGYKRAALALATHAEVAVATSVGTLREVAASFSEPLAHTSYPIKCMYERHCRT